MKKIGVFPGVFNPPHNFHFSIAQEILSTDSDFEKIIFVPTGNKYLKRDIIDAKHRHAMLDLVCRNNPAFEVSTIEMDQPVQLFSYQTLDLISELYPNYQIVLIIGSDNLKLFNTWRNYQYLLKKYTPLVYPRGDEDISKLIKRLDIPIELKKYIINFEFTIYTNLNSSLIREKVMNNKPIEYLVPHEIIEYINAHQLYK